MSLSSQHSPTTSSPHPNPMKTDSSASSLAESTKSPLSHTRSPLYITACDSPIPTLETTLALDNKVYLRHNNTHTEGILTIYDYGIQFQAFHVMMRDRDESHEEDHLLNFYLPYTMIQSLSKVQRGTTVSQQSAVRSTDHHPQNAIELQILTKHLRRIIFSIAQDKNTADVAVQAFMNAQKNRIRAEIYHQSVIQQQNQPLSQFNGWELYDPVKEYTRQGALDSPDWRLSTVNKNFAHIESYPEVFCVPKTLTDDLILNGLKKRSKERIPVLAWWDKTTGVSLARSAQPKRGLNLKRKKFRKDIAMLEAFIATNPQSKRMTIVDLRPKLNAQANRIKGAGFEDVSKYPNCELKFMNIANIHVMRESFHQVARLVMDTQGDSEDWLLSLSNTKWLQYTQLILKAGWTIVELMLQKNQTVLVHCSDGWDRCSQAICLAELLMDPYYRTLEGFCVLIQKDFIAYGHMFDKRVGHSSHLPTKELSPIFFQFLEVVHNLKLQFPTAFEFNEYFLIRIIDEVHACKFGTFLGNCDRDRHTAKVTETTQSLWTYLLHPENSRHYKNPIYVRNENALRPDLRMCSVQLWTNYWLRWSNQSVHAGPRFALSETLGVQQCASGVQEDDVVSEGE